MDNCLGQLAICTWLVGWSVSFRCNQRMCLSLCQCVSTGVEEKRGGGGGGGGSDVVGTTVRGYNAVLEALLSANIIRI